MAIIEEWRDVVGFEGLYEVSNLGRIKRLHRISPTGMNMKEKILKQTNHSKGYMRITLKDKDFNKKWDFVHRIVANAFILNLDKKTEVNHIDGDKKNNEISNLEWNNHDENMIHAKETNLFNFENHVKKLSYEDAKYIKDNYIPRDKQFGRNALAKMFNVNPETISNIIRNKTWKHING